MALDAHDEGLHCGRIKQGHTGSVQIVLAGAAPPLDVDRETSDIRLLALASRDVIGFRPKQVSIVAGIDA